MLLSYNHAYVYVLYKNARVFECQCIWHESTNYYNKNGDILFYVSNWELDLHFRGLSEPPLEVHAKGVPSFLSDFKTSAGPALGIQPLTSILLCSQVLYQLSLSAYPVQLIFRSCKAY